MKQLLKQKWWAILITFVLILGAYQVWHIFKPSTVTTSQHADAAKGMALWHDFQPSALDAFLNQLFLTLMQRDPQLVNKLGICDSIGLNICTELNDVSPRAFVDSLKEKKEVLQLLHKFPYATLSHEQQKVSYNVIDWMLKHAVEGEKFLFHEYKINQMDGVIADQIALFTQYQKLISKADLQTYNELLTKIPQQIEQIIQYLYMQRQKGIIPPRFMIEKVITMMQRLMPEDITKNIFYKNMVQKIANIPVDDKESYLKRAHDIIEHEVYPAYAQLIDYFKQLLTVAKTNDGVWALPDGDAYYVFMLKEHTTSNLSPDEIHQLGLREVAQIQQEIHMIFAQEDVKNNTKSCGDLLQELSKDRSFCYPNTEAGRAQCLKGYEAILERSRKELGSLFSLKPSAGVKILRVPVEEEEGKPVAYYFEPSMDGARPGAFFANLRNMEEIPKYGMETLTIHEAEPGHHFQLALQYEMRLPMLRRILCYTAYAEGWALYVEKLAYEHNFYSSSYAKIGHLQDELLRAVRLVVDTGIHHKRWSREKAIEYMQKVTGYNHDSVVTEIERYFVLPGQACSYKIGQLKILELRKRAQEMLGMAFDIREFHDVILKAASVPLDILEEVVNRYIEEKRAA